MDLSLNKKVIKNMHSQIYSGLSLIFAILRNFSVAGAQGSLCTRHLCVFFLRRNFNKIPYIHRHAYIMGDSF